MHALSHVAQGLGPEGGQIIQWQFQQQMEVTPVQEPTPRSNLVLQASV